MIKDIENKSQRKPQQRSLHSVFVVVEHIRYEGEYIIAIGDSLIQAKKLKESYEQKDAFTLNSDSHCEIQKWALNLL